MALRPPHCFLLGIGTLSSYSFALHFPSPQRLCSRLCVTTTTYTRRILRIQSYSPTIATRQFWNSLAVAVASRATSHLHRHRARPLWSCAFGSGLNTSLNAQRSRRDAESGEERRTTGSADRRAPAPPNKTPTWSLSSPIDFSRSSIRLPISSIRPMIWSDICSNRPCCAHAMVAYERRDQRRHARPS